MPIYEYRCRKCGNVQEIYSTVGGNEYRHRPCDRCGVTVWEKVPSAPSGFRFEGLLKDLK